MIGDPLGVFCVQLLEAGLMCGITGVVRLATSAPPASRDEALAMAIRIRHRGPDDQTAWLSATGTCALGHARLQVIDLETGDQPMANESGTVQVVFNGEIYNFRELRQELEAEGHRFRSRSDTEVLAHGYEAWGDALPEHVDGMFAFAIWDEAEQSMLLARDRVGKKPLFWTRQENRFAFASEIKALTALSWVPDEMDPEALPFYLAYGYVPAPRTFYRGIQKLPPGTAMTVQCERGAGTGDAEAITTRRYWQLHWSSGGGARSEQEEARRLRTLLGDAVERRLVSDVPLGAFLSGGVDSTVVVGLMRERIEGSIRTFSLGFADDPTYDESAYARMASKRFGTEHTEFTMESHTVDLVDELLEAYDEPFGDSSAIPTHIVSRLTREHVTVALTGDGGDEMFAGYPRFLGMTLAERLPGLVTRVGNAVGRRLPHHPNFRHPSRRFSQFFQAAALPPQERMLHWMGFFPAPEDVLRPDVGLAIGRDELLESFSAPWRRTRGSPLARTLALTLETYLPEDLLVKADRNSMAHGLELRSPFLDTQVMEFAAGLPDRMRIKGRRLKWLLRHAFGDLLPDPIAKRPKMGFGVPLPMWFRTDWRPMFEARVLSPDAQIWGWLQRAPVQRLWDAHQAGAEDHGHQLWLLLTLATWLHARD